MKASETPSSKEAQRCAFLHQLCLQIEARISAGMSLTAALRRASLRRRTALFPRGSVSIGSLTRHLYRWRQHRSPEVFRLRYRPGFVRVPLALEEEFLNRLASDRVVSANTVMQSMRADWRLGKLIPGLGTWREYVRKQRGEAGLRTTPPRFPFSYRTLIRCLGSECPAEFRQRITAALRAERELNRFLNFIESRRIALASRRNHEPITASIPERQLGEFIHAKRKNQNT